jgi:dihydropteroate synthase
MGVLNVTPDSFSDGARFSSPAAAADHARRLVEEGADLIDVGGESTRPGAAEVSVDEEIDRVVPVVERIAALGVPVSIDTRKATVAKAALDAGAHIVNDVSAGTFDPAMLPLAADRGVPIVLMHMRGTPRTMDSLTTYDDVAREVVEALRSRRDAARTSGIEEVWLDPGLGFAKDVEQTIALVRRIDDLRELGCPVVVGPSRKRFIGGDVSERLAGTLAIVAWCAMHDVAVVRVHDVLEARRVVDMIAKLT